jgi:hypothetical protein
MAACTDSGPGGLVDVGFPAGVVATAGFAVAIGATIGVAGFGVAAVGVGVGVGVGVAAVGVDVGVGVAPTSEDLTETTSLDVGATVDPFVAVVDENVDGAGSGATNGKSVTSGGTTSTGSSDDVSVAVDDEANTDSARDAPTTLRASLITTRRPSPDTGSSMVVRNRVRCVHTNDTTFYEKFANGWTATNPLPNRPATFSVPATEL